MAQTVMVLGASDRPASYSHKAIQAVLANGHTVIPVNPKRKTVAGLECLPSPSAYSGHVDTVTVYVNPVNLRTILDEVLALRPGRVIFNPGTEDEQIEQLLSSGGIPVLRACTIVMSKTGQF